ncbi:MAG TPA: efflux RND transporter periplasmic adaptor subunit [Chromatiales bacterium]|nr:efflux RND transporter periplasmic adaptor subunit [Chromatiales bacterium]
MFGIHLAILGSRRGRFGAVRGRRAGSRALLACLMPLSLLWTGPVAATAGDIRLDAAQREALGVVLTPVEPVTGSTSTAFPARVVVPNDQLHVVSTPLAGLLESLHAAEGQPVRKGDLLAVVQSPDLLEAQRAYVEALSRFQLAEANYRRDRQLHKEGIIAERRYLEARARYQEARTALDQRRQLLMLAGMDEEALAQLTETHRLSGRLEVRSPLDGVVLEQMATPGQRLEAQDPIYKVGRLQPLWLEVHVPLDRLGGVRPGSPVQVIEPPIEARVITVGRMVHTEDQGVLVRAQVDEGSELLFPGQFVKVALLRSQNGGYRVPRSALVRHRGRVWVFVGRGELLEPVPVELVAEEAHSAVVRGALRTGDRIVSRGTSAVKAIWLGAGT